MSANPLKKALCLAMLAGMPFSALLAQERLLVKQGGFADRGGRRGFVDRQGNWVVAPSYDDVQRFAEGRAIVGTKDSQGVYRFGYINLSEPLVIPQRYELAYSFFRDWARVAPGKADSGTYSWIDKQGAIACRPAP